MNKNTKAIIDDLVVMREKETGASIIATVEHIDGQHVESNSIVGNKAELLDLLTSLCVKVLSGEGELMGLTFLLNLTNRLKEDNNDN